MLFGDPATKGDWADEWYKWPEDIPVIVDAAIKRQDNENVYFSAHLFDAPTSTKQHVLPTFTIQADLDEADVSTLAMAPTVLVETSPGRHQGYWLLDPREPLTPQELEGLSRRLTYSVPDCDKSGWSLGHKVRLPGTLNHKYIPTRPVHTVSISLRRYTRAEINEQTREAEQAVIDKQEADEAWINGPHSPGEAEGPQELFERVRTKLSRPSIVAFNTEVQKSEANPEGRSGALWGLMLDCFRAGLSRDEVFTLAKASPNNKFADNKWHGDTDLAKDVLRAQKTLTEQKLDIKDTINRIRHSQGMVAEKRSAMSYIVIHELEKHGEFVLTQDNQQWYLDRRSGRPILVSRYSDYLDALLETEFDLNATDRDTQHVVKSLSTFTISRGRTARSAVLSYTSGASMLLHGGRKDVFHITPNSIETLSNGSHGVLFPWRPGETPFIPQPIPTDAWDWCSFIFEGHFQNAVDHDPQTVKDLLRIWFLFLLFREEAVNCPVLALFGQPGSGKSTTFRLLYTLLYGPGKALNAVTSQDNFDFLVSTDPFVVLDNVDTWSQWLPDRIALSAARSDFVKRKLYTDVETITMKRQALLGITAHAPKFGREDVVDRMLLLNFDRLQTFADETEMIEKVLNNRDRIWGAIVRDIQAVLQTPYSPADQVPQFRISDFARVGWRIAQALDLQASFSQAITTTKVAQTAFNLSEEDMLISAIQRWHQHRKDAPIGFLNPAALWEAWAPYNPGFEKQYKSSLALGKKLQTLETTLRSVFDVSFEYDRVRGTRSWRIEPKQV